ncbi:MAG: hypothetical protein JEZ06_22425 [Anaerolineaceae bacterium]|nr:hypothetical protein [Anaerolineaceae bacterium]
MKQSNSRIIRYLWFSVSILIGVLLGFYFGWVLKPLKYTDMQLSQLREDYKADYVLMTAEIFSDDDNIQAAERRLGRLDANQTPVRITQQAILDGRAIHYSADDLELMVRLSQELLLYAENKVQREQTP